MRSTSCCRMVVLSGLINALAPSAVLADNQSAGGSGGPSRQELVDRGVQYLLTKGQADDGSFSAKVGPAITALCATALIRSGRSPDDPAVAKALTYVEQFVQPDGGVYSPDSTHRNYESAVAIMCFAAANKDGRYAKLVDAAEKYVKEMQWDAGESADSSHMNYGGAGYGRSNRPDLSNTSFFLDALQAAGAGADDEAVKKALIFVSRCQNLEGQSNTTAFAGLNPDGGFYYTPAAGGSSMAGKTDNDGLRSYGSMTYAGLKSMIFAGVGPDDPRVKAAVAWIRKNYDLAKNPGMDQAGLYYYYHTFAKALAALGSDKLVDANGVEHDWKAELIDALAKQQREDGSWYNDQKRWMEGDPNLVTSYVLLALSYCGNEKLPHSP